MARAGALDTARIGPNAIVRTGEALAAYGGEGLTRRLFEAAGLGAYLQQTPGAMVPEREVVALHRAVREALAAPHADAVMRDAGARTARYLLSHRIPAQAQRLLRLLPAGLAARLLLRLIGRHAWTFAGSAQVDIRPGRPARVIFHGSPFAREVHADAPVCGFYAGTFAILFEVLVDPRAIARETACLACGADACTLELNW